MEKRGEFDDNLVMVEPSRPIQIRMCIWVSETISYDALVVLGVI